MTKLTNLTPYLATIDDPLQRQQLTDLIQWIITEFPNLETKIAWNQPMFTDHGTFILGLSTAKHHFSVAPEGKTIQHFAKDIQAAGYNPGKQFMRIKWDQPVDYTLLKNIIQYNIDDKKETTTFWRK